MARMTIDSLEAKIKKAEERVIRTGEIYNAACEDLQKLREKKTAIENEALVEAFIKSDKTLEEAIVFLTANGVKGEPEEVSKKPAVRRGRKRKTTAN